ncbi:MAG: LacI family DNA-binding transcriptional regulator [Bifidobacteriaceae bacterium]|jgi:LacI family xylobiose transport system transcriptional regulator|nr:LacI family DNA-binding transcriptional regulator [Bifidobacteriaceae bacterium]
MARVARDAAVSISTVSKVLNGRPGVSAAVRERVERALDQHGYSPRGDAQRMATVDVVVPQLETDWMLEILRGLEQEASARGLALVLTPAVDPSPAGKEWVERVIEHKSRAVVVVFEPVSAAQQARLRHRGFPFVVLDPAGTPGGDVASVGSQNWPGGWAVADHLLALGHRDIAVIGRQGGPLWWRARYSGFVSRLEQEGLEIKPEYIRSGDFRVPDGLVQGQALLRLPEPPTAIFAGADLQAVGVYEAARQLGVRIPEDLSVVGYDDLPIAEWISPALTTVRQPIRKMAATAVRMALEPATGQANLALATELVIRESTGQLKRSR